MTKHLTLLLFIGLGWGQDKCEEGFYKDGRREGECISYYENGEKELVGYFKKGKPTGIWMYWYKDGRYE